jgi:hypothetical protein
MIVARPTTRRGAVPHPSQEKDALARDVYGSNGLTILPALFKQPHQLYVQMWPKVTSYDARISRVGCAHDLRMMCANLKSARSPMRHYPDNLR